MREKITCAFLILFICPVFTTLAQTQTMVLKPNAAQGEDVTLFDGFPNQNLEPYPSLINASWTCQGSPCTDRSLLRFDLTSIPANATIITAYLSLFADLTQTVSPTPMYGIANTSLIQQITSSWIENSVIWNTQPTVSAIGQIILVQSSTPFQDYLNIDVAALVSGWVASPASNYGMLMRLQNETYYNAMIFASSDNADSSKFPELTVTYTTPSGLQAISDKNFVDVFPNPFQHQLKLKLNEHVSEGQSEIFIRDIAGKIILSQQIALKNGPVLLTGTENLLPGIYCIEIKNGQHVFRKKIVKI